jgi:hypothetical protein
MENLKSKLSQLNAETEPSEIREYMAGLAGELLKNYHIQKGKDEYYLAAVEFYFCSKKHPDIITYPRELEAGQWFFHQSGIDLTFKSRFTPYNNHKSMVDTEQPYFFGGILVRQILKRSNMELFDGPYKCEWELFDKFDALCPRVDEMPILVPNDKSLAIHPRPRTRQFSYAGDKLERKYQELVENVFCENCQVTKEMFKRFIKEEKLAYDINKDELKNAFMSL